MKHFLILIALCASLMSWSQNQSIEFRQISWNETLEAAKEESKPIFMDCFAVWCGPCKWMSANIFTNEEVAEYYNTNYICVKFDMEKGEGKELAKQFGVRAYPTLLYLDSDETILLQVVGASEIHQDYIDNGITAQDPDRNMPYYLANKEMNFDDQVFMEQYFTMMTQAYNVDQEEVETYLKQFPAEEWANDNNWNIIKMTLTTSKSEVFQYMMENQGLFIEKYGSTATDLMGNILYGDLANMYYRAKTDEAKKEYIEFKKETLSSDFVGIEKIDFMINSFEYSREKKWENYCQLNVNHVDQYYFDNANQLNSIAWKFFEVTDDKTQLDKALSWAKRASELEPTSHAILDTYANLLYKTGNLNLALEVEESAFEKASANGEDVKSYQALINKIKGEL